MKIAVVGTSNSILASGYFPLYRAMEYPNQVDNFSHGASYCHYIPFALEKYAILENYDFLITDCCPNDGSFFPYARTETWLYNELYSVFSHIKEKNCKHLHLIFPTNLPFAVHEEIHRQVCTELAVPFLDIGAILKNSPQTPGQPLYADKMHIAPFYAKQLSCIIRQKRQEITNSLEQTEHSFSCKHKEYFIYDLTKIFHFRPIPANTFPVTDFLKIKAGFNLECQEIMEEFNIQPVDKNNSELLINALLFSKELNPPLPWQPKETPSINEKDLKNYNKINTVINKFSRHQNNTLFLPDEFILVGAALFPAHTILRKSFVTILKTTQNPYYFFYFAQFYLLPRKKYSMAGRMLEYALTLKNDILFSELLVKCYLAQNLVDKARFCIQQKIPAHNPVIRLKLLLAWADKTKNKKAFIGYAKEMLEYGTSLNHMALLAEYALSFQEYELAKEFFAFIANDPRNFQHERDRQRINYLIKKIKPFNFTIY